MLREADVGFTEHYVFLKMKHCWPYISPVLIVCHLACCTEERRSASTRVGARSPVLALLGGQMHPGAPEELPQLRGSHSHGCQSRRPEHNRPRPRIESWTGLAARMANTT